MTVRDQLNDLLQDRCPDTWRVIPVQRGIDVPDRPTVLLKQSEIERLPQAPNGAYQVTYTVTIVSASTDPGNADLDLDDCVFTLLDVLYGIGWLNVGTAKKAKFDDQHLCYDIDCTLITKKDNS